MATDTKVFQFLLEDVTVDLNTFITNTSATVASVAGAVGSTLLAIYVMFWGISLLSGQTNEPMMDGAKRILRGIVILTFATSAGVYSDFVVDFFWKFPGSFASEIITGAGYSNTGDTATVAAMLDAALGRGLEAGSQAWNEMSNMDIMASFGYGLVAIVTWVIVALVTAGAAAMVLVANIGLAVMLGIGPIFILCAMFESTQQLFVAWTRQVITYAIFFVIIATIIALMFSFFEIFMSRIDLASFSQLVVNFVMLIAISAACIFVLWRAESMASNLGGGIGISAGNAVGRMIGGGASALAGRDYAGRWRGAIPSVTRTAAKLGGTATLGVVSKAASYMRRNQIKGA